MRLIVVGCGSMGRRRIRHALEFPETEVAVFDIREDRMNEVKELFPSITCLGNRAAVQDQDADGIFIVVPPSDHEDYISLALDRQLPFMCEQPISDRLDNLSSIRDTVAKTELICHVSNNQRYSPRITTLKLILGAGRVGKPLAGTVELGEWLPNWHPYEPYQDYYPSWRRLGGGLDAVCDLDWLRYLFGEPERIQAMCSRKSDLEIDTYDVTQFLIDFGEDHPQIALHLDMLQRPFARQSRIICSNGVIVHNHPDQFHRVFYADEERWEQVDFGVDLTRFPSMQGKDHAFAEPMYEVDSLEFLTRVRDGNFSLYSLDNGIRNISLVLPLVFGEGPAQ